MEILSLQENIYSLDRCLYHTENEEVNKLCTQFYENKWFIKWMEGNTPDIITMAISS